MGEAEWVKECHYHDPAFPGKGINFPSVWKDPETEQWRMIYSTQWSPFTMMVATSEDGIHWKPLPIPYGFPVGGEGRLAPNHIFTAESASGSAIYHDPQKTDGYAFRIFGRQRGEPVFKRALADPNHPWHKDAREKGDTPYMDEGITYVSKDGMQWEMKTGAHWNWQQKDWYPEPPVFAFWNEQLQQHVMLARPGWGDRRQCWRTSKDLKTWTDAELLFQPDSQDTQGPIGMYGLPVHPVGNGAGYIGLLWIFHNSSSEPVNSFNQFFGTMDAQLVYSYDGVRFNRGPREAFIKRNPIPNPGCIQVRPTSIVETDEVIHIYSEGSKAAHGREKSQQRLAENENLGSLVLHKLRKDGWMYLESSGDWGRIQTKPFTLRAPAIHINAAANYGEVRFQLTNEKSQPIEGFSFEDCIPMRGKDSLKHPLQWKNDIDLQTVLNQPLRLEIKFRQANLYSLEMDHHFLDAHDMWLLKDGKSLPKKPRFDF